MHGKPDGDNMKSKSYQYCVEIVRFLVEKDYTNQVNKSTLNLAINVVRGGDPRTLVNWRKNLERLGFIKRVNASVYRLNLKLVPELLNVVVRRGQKKLL